MSETYGPYYSPEALSLEILCSKDIAGDYEFDMCVMWKHGPSGRLFYAFDSGCSCPTPYEGVWFNEEGGKISTSMQEITVTNWEGAAQEMEREHFDKGEIYKLLKSYFGER